MHSLGYVHRDVSPFTIAFGCFEKEDIAKWNAPFKLSENGHLYFTSNVLIIFFWIFISNFSKKTKIF